jgi:hypothetical protein
MGRGSGEEARGAMAFPAERDVSPSLVIRGGTMITIGPKVIVAGVATLALGAGTGIATAAMMTSASPVDSSGVIHGCWTNRAVNGSHVFVLQNAGTNCPQGTTAISWNQRGPAGAPGPAGPAGHKSAAGRVSSLDQLNGIPCDHGAGTTSLSYGSNGAVSIRCVSRTAIPTPTPTPTPTKSSILPTLTPTTPTPTRAPTRTAIPTPTPTFPTPTATPPTPTT